MSGSPNDPASLLSSEAIAFVGKLGAVSKRAAGQLVRKHGGAAVDLSNSGLTTIVVGADESPLATDAELLGAELQARVDAGEVSIISETQFWQRLGVMTGDAEEDRLYTPAMLAELLDVPLAIIRRWTRRGLIVPSHRVHRLPYFSFQEVSTARTLAQLLAAGATPRSIEKKLERLAQRLPDVQRPLAQLTVMIEGRQLLLRQGDGLIDAGGQFRFDFAALDQSEEESPALATLPLGPLEPTIEIESPEELRHLAFGLEDEGRLAEATDVYRAALAAGGPCAETNFQLAELLYRQGDLTAARERYYVVIEIDEQFVEARHNLGCLLVEIGEPELAAAAFEGALSIHGDYADAHYHLAQTLDQLGRRDEAETHWRRFLELASNSPWADDAQDRLSE